MVVPILGKALCKYSYDDGGGGGGGGGGGDLITMN